MEDVSTTQNSYMEPTNWVYLRLVREAKAMEDNVSACASRE
jgi:hypothetical protein